MGKTNSNFFRASLNAKSVKGFFMAAICLSTRGSHVGLKSYMAGTCDQARVVIQLQHPSHLLNDCFRATLLQRNGFRFTSSHSVLRNAKGKVPRTARTQPPS